MQLNKAFVVIAILATVHLYGCGGGGEDSGDKAPAASHSAGGGTTTTSGGGASTGTSSIVGTVTFAGSAPAPAKIKMDADMQCKAMHPDGATTQDVIVNSNGTLKWVFAQVKSGLEGHTYATPTDPVTLDQVGCTYEPHVFGIMANQPLKILNSDATMHNIHSLSKNSRQFNLAMPRQGMEITKKFKSPETMVRIKCDVHPWMETWAGVMDHPFYAVSDDSGKFTIRNLPAGTFTIEIWHEEYGTQTQSVTVGDGETKQVEFTVQAQT